MNLSLPLFIPHKCARHFGVLVNATAIKLTSKRGHDTHGGYRSDTECLLLLSRLFFEAGFSLNLKLMDVASWPSDSRDEPGSAPLPNTGVTPTCGSPELARGFLTQVLVPEKKTLH